MEKIYEPQNFNASDKINMNDYLKDFKYLLPKDYSIDTINNMENNCSIDKLSHNGEIYGFPLKNSDKYSSIVENHFKDPLLINDNWKNLHTLEQNEWKDTIPNKKRMTINYNIHIPDNSKPDLKQADDYIVTILIYHPFSYKYSPSYTKNSLNDLKLSQEICILGRNNLAELKDLIKCPADEKILQDHATLTDTNINNIIPKEIYPSSFFYIDNIFYNDTRSSNAIDLTKPIRDWLINKNYIDESPKTYTMHTITINNLQPRFGYPYLFLHQGDCEHILMFSDLKLLQNNDKLYTEIYPYVLRSYKKIRLNCLLCSFRPSNWMIVDSKRLPVGKVFLCNQCCKSYNFLDGKKVENFKLYPQIY